MGTIKADSIQPTAGGNNLSLKAGMLSGSDAERVSISPTGDINVSANITTLGSGNATLVGNLNVNGVVSVSTLNTTNFGVSQTLTSNLPISGKATSTSTSTSDSSTTLTTKDYVDSLGIVILDNQVSNIRSVTMSSTFISNRQTIELHPNVPATAKYVILTIHGFAMGNNPYNIWFGNSLTLNSGHRTHYQTDTSDGDATTNSIQVFLPINKISASSRQVYWNISSTPNGGDTMNVDLVGYVI